MAAARPVCRIACQGLPSASRRPTILRKRHFFNIYTERPKRTHDVNNRAEMAKHVDPLAARGEKVTDFAAHYAALAKEFKLDTSKQVTSTCAFPQKAFKQESVEELERKAYEASKSTIDLDMRPFATGSQLAVNTTKTARYTEVETVSVLKSANSETPKRRRPASNHSSPSSGSPGDYFQVHV